MKESLKIASYLYTIESLPPEAFVTKFCEIHSDVNNVESMCRFSDGFIDYSQQVVYVRDSLHRDVLATCVLGLIIELLANASGLDSLSGIAINSVTQVVMAVLSPHLLQVLRDNEEVLRRLNVIGQRSLP